jgi:peptide/nickel transport system permease protein
MSSARLLGRLLAAIVALLGASLIAFALGVIAPGDPAVAALSQGGDVIPSAEAIAALRAEWGLDQPLHVQYLSWLGRVLQGDLGTSYFSGEPVLVELGRRLGATLLLAISATLVATVLGVGMGVICVLWRDSLLDMVLRNVSVLLASLPGFLIGIFFIALFAEILQLVPTSGYGTPAHLVLPTLALSLGETARLLRLTRTQLIDEVQRNYMVTARAKGRTRTAAILRHALPNTLINVLTSLGLYVGEIIGGAAIIETIFAWPGLGQLAVDAIRQQDVPVAQGVVLLSASIYVSVHLLVDVLYGVIDPRFRRGVA